MFAIDCPYCQHQNTPGARFCADCGAALHLRPCPTCGKVDDVVAKTCVSCGRALPPLKLAKYALDEIAAGADAVDKPKVEAVPPVGRRANEKPQSHALPLIIVALVAGGLPLLWMNRADLPMPKAWKGSVKTNEAEGSFSPPPAFSSHVKPITPAPQAAPASPPASPAAAKEPAVVATETTAESTIGVAAEPDAAPAAALQQTKTLVKTTKERSRNGDRAQASAASPPRPCTEAVAALGLCDPKQVIK